MYLSATLSALIVAGPPCPGRAALLRILFPVIAPVIIVDLRDRRKAHTVHNRCSDVVLMLVFGVLHQSPGMLALVLALVMTWPEVALPPGDGFAGSLAIFWSNALVAVSWRWRPPCCWLLA